MFPDPNGGDALHGHQEQVAVLLLHLHHAHQVNLGRLRHLQVGGRRQRPLQRNSVLRVLDEFRRRRARISTQDAQRHQQGGVVRIARALTLRSGLRQARKVWRELRQRARTLTTCAVSTSLRRLRLPVQWLRVRLAEPDGPLRLRRQAARRTHRQGEGARIHRVLTHHGQARHGGVNDHV